MTTGLDRTYHAHRFIFSFIFNFLFVPCGGLSWLPVSFLLHVKYTLSYRIVYAYSALLHMYTFNTHGLYFTNYTILSGYCQGEVGNTVNPLDCNVLIVTHRII